MAQSSKSWYRSVQCCSDSIPHCKQHSKKIYYGILWNKICIKKFDNISAKCHNCLPSSSIVLRSSTSTLWDCGSVCPVKSSITKYGRTPKFRRNAVQSQIFSGRLRLARAAMTQGTRRPSNLPHCKRTCNHICHGKAGTRGEVI